MNEFFPLFFSHYHLAFLTFHHRCVCVCRTLWCWQKSLQKVGSLPCGLLRDSGVIQRHNNNHCWNTGLFDIKVHPKEKRIQQTANFCNALCMLSAAGHFWLCLVQADLDTHPGRAKPQAVWNPKCSVPYNCGPLKSEGLQNHGILSQESRNSRNTPLAEVMENQVLWLVSSSHATIDFDKSLCIYFSSKNTPLTL